jgi:uncharacterized Zn finger protein (UPF0148 family)
MAVSETSISSVVPQEEEFGTLQEPRDCQIWWQQEEQSGGSATTAAYGLFPQDYRSSTESEHEKDQARRQVANNEAAREQANSELSDDPWASFLASSKKKKSKKGATAVMPNVILASVAGEPAEKKDMPSDDWGVGASSMSSIKKRKKAKIAMAAVATDAIVDSTENGLAEENPGDMNDGWGLPCAPRKKKGKKGKETAAIMPNLEGEEKGPVSSSNPQSPPDRTNELKNTESVAIAINEDAESARKKNQDLSGVDIPESEGGNAAYFNDCAKVGQDLTTISQRDASLENQSKFWFCSECGDGPNNISLAVVCSMCGHIQCTYCPIESAVCDEPPLLSTVETMPFALHSTPQGERQLVIISQTCMRCNTPITDEQAECPICGDHFCPSKVPGEAKQAIHNEPSSESFAQYFLSGPSDLQRILIEDDDKNSSAVSSYAASIASVFSVESLASSASEHSKASGYSAIQVATATKVLISIFHEDEVLRPLYESAVSNLSIGPERLERNLRRLLKAYAKHLGNESTEHLEYLASQLVALKARWLARSVVEKFQTKRESERKERIDRHDESSDEEDEPRPVNEAAFEDLVILREFLIKSHAFEILRAQVHAFVLPKIPGPSQVEHVRQSDEANAQCQRTDRHLGSQTKGVSKLRTWKIWRGDFADIADACLRGPDKVAIATPSLYLLTDAMILTSDALMIATGLLERQLLPDQVRLRWSCVSASGHSYADYTWLYVLTDKLELRRQTFQRRQRAARRRCR